jgi:phosphinothricin acetyltransferase
MSHCLIRPSEPGDIPSITAIYTDAVRFGTASFELEPPDEADMARRRQHLVDGGFPYLVAIDQPSLRLLGYAYAGPYRPRPAYRFTLEDSIYLAPEARGRGIGSRLLSHLITAAEVFGARRMIANIGDSVNEASIRVHRRAGFEMIGIMPSAGFKHGRWLDCVLMHRPIGPGDTTLPV